MYIVKKILNLLCNSFIAGALLLLFITTDAYAAGLPLSFLSQPSFPQVVQQNHNKVVYYQLKNNTGTDLPLSFNTSISKGRLNVIAAGNTCGNRLVHFGQCTLAVEFQAGDQLGQNSGKLQINYDGRYPLVANPLVFTVQAPPEPPLIMWSQPTYPQTLNVNESRVNEYVIKNRSQQTVALSYKSGIDQGTLVIDNVQNTCGTSIAPNSTCVLPIKYTAPNQALTATGHLEVIPNGNEADKLVANPLIFNVIAPPPPPQGQFQFYQSEEPVSAIWVAKNSNGEIDLENVGQGTIHSVHLTLPPQLHVFSDHCTGLDLGQGESCKITYTNANSTLDQEYFITAQGDNAGNSPDNLGVTIYGSGAAQCWGLNESGELGVGEDEWYLDTPASVVNAMHSEDPLEDVVAISGGEKHDCALLASGQVRCWGDNSDGQLGNNQTGYPEYAPVTVETSETDTQPLSDVQAIAAGGYHTCALLNTSQVQCWGNNDHGQLGVGDKDSRDYPLGVIAADNEVNPLSNVTALTAGLNHTCALLDSGQAKCWGDDEYGQLGNGKNNDSIAPIDVGNGNGNNGSLKNIQQISAGGQFTCALLDHGKIKCWGNNSMGQLGNNSNDLSSNKPVFVREKDNQPLSGAIAIGTGTDFACALMTDKTVKCWGNNDLGQLGNGDEAMGKSSVPTTVVAGSNNSQVPFTGAISLMATGDHACALMEDGSEKCWGNGEFGQLGNGESGDNYHSYTPVTVINTGKTVLALMGDDLGAFTCQVTQ